MYQVSVKTNADLELTFFDSLVARVAHAGGLKVSVSEGRLVGAAGGAHHLAAGAAVVAPDQQRELCLARLAHGHPVVRHPHRGGLPQLALSAQGQGGSFVSDEGVLLLDEVLLSCTDGLHPLLSFFYVPANTIMVP